MTVTITDTGGKIIYSATATDIHKTEVSTKNFAEGIYLVKIKGDEFVET